jgi:RND family efflux transporter MFP subunit
MSNLSKPSKYKWPVVMLVLAVTFAALILLMMAAGSGQVTEPPQQAKIHKVTVQQLELLNHHQQSRMTYGKVEASIQSNLGFELAGRITEILADEGDTLNKGALLAKLDTSRLEASKKEINATLARTEADLRLASLSLKRVTELVDKKLESKQKLDEITESTASAAALVSEIKAKKDTLQLEIEKSALYAPHPLTVLSQPVDVGTVVAAGQTIFSVQQNNVFEVRMGMPQDQAFALEQGQTHKLLYGNHTLFAKVKSVAKQRQLNTRTIDVIFSIDVPTDLSLLPGDLVNFTYQQVVNESGAWVPKEALTSGIRGLWTLFVVSSTGQQAVSSKSVEILYSEQGKVFVRGAIKQGEWLVTKGGHRLVPAQLVHATHIQETNGN